ncbi:MAG: hypothetical protein Q9207_002786 [Kuettlingeria erythrocarpa]
MATDAASPVATNARMDLRKYDQQIREARNHYGTSEKPEFALGRERARACGVDIGDLKDVVLATATGNRPEEPMSSTTFSLEAREWDQHFFFWTLDLGDQRIIVKLFPSSRSGYRRWLGVDEKFDKKYIAFPVLDPLESPPRDPVSGRQLSRRLATKRRAGELAELSGPENPTETNIPPTISRGKSALLRRPRRVETGSSSSEEDSLSSDDEPLTSRRLPKTTARRGRQNDESTPASTVSSPSALLAVNTGSRDVNWSLARKRVCVLNPEGLPERSGAGVGRAAATSRPAVILPPPTRLTATNSTRARNAAQNERDELSRREAEVAQELQVFINLKKELNTIRRRKEELAQED